MFIETLYALWNDANEMEKHLRFETPEISLRCTYAESGKVQP